MSNCLPSIVEVEECALLALGFIQIRPRRKFRGEEGLEQILRTSRASSQPGLQVYPSKAWNFVVNGV